jgi:hypothetical protein
MKRNIIVIFAILIGNLFAFAQRHEIGIQLGTSNLVGDIGKPNTLILSQITLIIFLMKEYLLWSYYV